MAVRDQKESEISHSVHLADVFLNKTAASRRFCSVSLFFFFFLSFAVLLLVALRLHGLLIFNLLSIFAVAIRLKKSRNVPQSGRLD